MLSLCLRLVWKFANHWSKQHGCCWLSGDMKRMVKMEPRQKSSTQAGILSLHSGTPQFCSSLSWRNRLQRVSRLYLILPRRVLADLVFCTTNHTGRRSTPCLFPSRTGKKTRGEEIVQACGHILEPWPFVLAAQTLLQSVHPLDGQRREHWLVIRAFLRFESCSSTFFLQNWCVPQESSLYAHTLTLCTLLRIQLSCKNMQRM